MMDNYSFLNERLKNLQNLSLTFGFETALIVIKSDKRQTNCWSIFFNDHLITLTLLMLFGATPFYLLSNSI